MKINERLVWDYDLSKVSIHEEAFRRWYIARVLTRGTLADVRAVGFPMIRRALPSLVLPIRVRRFWEFYFALLPRAG